jgi:hypothetical protein
MSGLIGYIVVLSSGINCIGLTFHSATLIKNLHALHLDEWRFQKIKRFHWKFWEKSVFYCGADSPGPWGGRSVGSWVLFNIWDFCQSFLRKILFGWKVRGSSADGPKLTSKQTERCATWVDRADGPRGRGEQSAGSWRTVLPTQRATLTAVDFAFFTVEIQARTVRDVHVFDITASNGKGEYKYSMPGLRESPLALWKVHTPL